MPPLKNYIDGSHNNVKLTDDEFKRVALWLDLNSMEFGAEYNVEDQKKGKRVWPRMDIDTTNPQGMEFLNDCICDNPSSVVNLVYSPNRINKNGSVISLRNHNFEITAASIFDLSGRCVYKLNFDKKATTFALNIKELRLAKGTYIFKAFGSHFDRQISPVRFMIN